MSSDTTRIPRQIGNYDVLAKIAEGGMGAVYKGRSHATGEIVAIKVIPTETARNPLLLKRFEQEFKAACLIDHPNVVKAIDYCGTGPNPFLVMEFVDGESMGQRVERLGAFAEADAVRLIGQVCEGLHRAHKQGLIHRDVKPDNIMVTHDGAMAKLTDLGLVKDVEGEMNLTRTGRGLGTPHFMAPEQFRDAKNAGVRCDVYSLAATLYCLVTGAIPFSRTSPLDCWVKKTKDDLPQAKSLNPSLSDRTNWAIGRAMKADPSQRPASCREFMEDLTGTGWLAPASGALLTPAIAAPEPAAPPVDDLWYMVFRDAHGEKRTVKGTTDSIRRNLAAGVLGDVTLVHVCRSKTGQFVPLRSVAEFQDVVISGPSSGQLNVPTSRQIPTSPDQAPSGRSTPTGRASGPKSTRVPPDATPSPNRESWTAETVDHRPAPHVAFRDGPTAKPKAKYDWTPWVLLLIALVAAGVGLLFFIKK